MFTLARPFRATVLFAVLASTLVLADSNAHELKRFDVGGRHHAARLEKRDPHFGKRFDNARFTFFDDGTNACGSFDQPGDFIVALNTHQWDGGSHCYDEITITYEGKSAKAKITDECEECPYGAIDLSRGLFTYLVPGGFEQGTAYGSWVYGDGDAAPSPAPSPTTTSHTTTHKTSTTPTSTKHSTTSTTPTSTSTSTKTTSSTSSTSSSSTSSSTSAAPTATQVTFDTGILNQFNLAIIQLANLVDATYQTA